VSPVMGTPFWEALYSKVEVMYSHLLTRTLTYAYNNRRCDITMAAMCRTAMWISRGKADDTTKWIRGLMFTMYAPCISIQDLIWEQSTTLRRHVDN